MVYQERNTWATLIAGTITTAVYLFIIVPQLATTPVADIDWVTPLLWTLGSAIVAAIVLSIVLGIAAGMRDPDASVLDQRDREISRMGDRVGRALGSIGALVALVLAMFEADWFWIGNAIFFGFYLASVLGGIAQIVAYRRGLV